VAVTCDGAITVTLQKMRGLRILPPLHVPW
jgi:hypothetical protein